MTKISGLAAVTSLLTGDEFVVARAGATKKIDADFLPGFEFAYVEFTSNVAVSATVEATPNDVVSAGAVTFDGSTRVCIEFFAAEVETGTTAGSFLILGLWDGATHLGRIGYVENDTAATDNVGVPVCVRRFLTPTAASHTYKISAHRINSNGQVAAGAGGVATSLPGYIRITKA